MHTLCQELYILALLVMCVVKIRLYMAWGGSVQSATTMTSVPLATWVANTVWSMHLYDLTVWEIGMCVFFFLDKLCNLCLGWARTSLLYTFCNVTWSSLIKNCIGYTLHRWFELLSQTATSLWAWHNANDATEFQFFSRCTSHYSFSLLTSTVGSVTATSVSDSG